MKRYILPVIVLSYILPSAFKLEAFIRDGRPALWLFLPILSSALVITTSYLTLKGSLVSKYITCIFFMLCGLYMVPWYFAPVIEETSLRLFLGSYGIVWIVSAIWIFRSYPEKRKSSK